MTAGQMSAEESAESMAENAAALEELVRELKAIQAAAASEQAGTQQEKKDGDALEKFVEAIRIDAEEARKLDSLGRKLQNGGAEPNIVDDHNSTKVERKPQQREK
ncbi:hypothetical protein ES703_73022 [subsurface metagenome]